MKMSRTAAAWQALRLGSGILEAGLSSLAGFSATLYAVRFLDSAEFGAFALYLSASIVGGLLPQHLLFLPAQMAALELPAGQRAAMLTPTLLLGSRLIVLAAPFVAMAGLVTHSAVEGDALLAFAVGAVVLTALTPLQDHVRSTLYLDNHPQRAAFMSACQFVVTLCGLGVLQLLGVPSPWIPFAGLASGVGASLVLGLGLTRSRNSDNHSFDSRARDLLRVGRPLLPAALLQEGTVFAASAILVALTSAATLGMAEAARIVSRPSQVLSLGLGRSLAPRLMESGRARSSLGTRNVVAVYVAMIGLAGVAYLAAAGWSYPYSPFVELLPMAYQSDGLVALFVIGSLLGTIAQIPRAVLLGAGQGKATFFLTLVGSVIRLAGVVLMAMALEAYALPAAQIASLLVVGWLGARWAMRLLKPA